MEQPQTLELVTLREAQRRLGVEYRTLQKARDAGAFRVYRLGKRWQRVRMSDLEAWLETCLVRTG